MQKITIILFLFLNVLLADTQDVLKYQVDLSLFGKVGNVEIIVDTNDKEYQIKLNAKTAGAVAKLSKQKVTYISRGKIINGKFITDTFEKHTTKEKNKSYGVYLFDHDDKEINFFEEETKEVKTSYFDTNTFRYVDKMEQKKSEKNEKLDYYSYYDTLSILLNLQNIVKNSDDNSIQPIGAVKDNQTITLEEIKGKKSDNKFSQKYDFEKILLLRVDKKGKKYEILIGLDEKGMLKEAVTKKSIFLIGDGKLNRVSYENLKKVDNVDLQ